MSESSSEEGGHRLSDSKVAAQESGKKRRIQRACDICRRKKIRCDGVFRPGHQCTMCETHNRDCTYDMASKKRGPPTGYVESLEDCLQKMGALLRKFCPDIDLSKELGQLEHLTWPKPSSQTGTTPSAPIIPSSVPSPEADDHPASDDEDQVENQLVNNLKLLHLNPSHARYAGKSSPVGLIRQVIEVRNEYMNTNETRPTYNTRRPEFWTADPWMTSLLNDPPAHREFPPTDLMGELIHLYFKHVNDYFPLLHRQTFERQITEGVHLWDEGFGSTVLLVCAVGSYWSDDPRVLLDGNKTTHSRGWKYFRQVQLVRKSLLSPPRLYDLQISVLTVHYLSNSSTPQASWTVVGAGLRMAQDVGAHRKKVYGSVYTVEDELWKRAFWLLLCFDRTLSMVLGRSCAMHDEDYDLEMPVECDDENWIVQDGKVTFRQPSGKPSKLSFFTCVIRIHQIIAFALRTIYSINKSKALLGLTGLEWEQNIVAELDSALNKWVDAIPEHLRWDPHRENELFLTQSALLYTVYYHVQIEVHRPFIPTSSKPSPLSFPSLAICTNAARSIIHVMNVPYRRFKNGLPFMHATLFVSAIIILLNIWGGKRSGLTIDVEKEMADVHTVMEMMKSLETRCYTAGRLWDVVYGIASAGNVPLPPHPTISSTSKKRAWASDVSKARVVVPNLSRKFAGAQSSTGMSFSAEHVTQVRGPREDAGLKPSTSQPLNQYASAAPSHPEEVSYPYFDTTQPLASSFAMPSSAPENHMVFSELPLHSDDLGKIPIHPGFNNSDPLVANTWFTENSADSFLYSDLTVSSQSVAPSSNVLGMQNNITSSGSDSVTSLNQMMPNFTSSPPSTTPAGGRPFSLEDLLHFTGDQSPASLWRSDTTSASAFSQYGFNNDPRNHNAQNEIWDDWESYFSNVPTYRHRDEDP
ncbi:hypothetical protein K474DRAFT_1768947 [Panus rudis PR-1116 ss-1]|nr:hypothetical protein K474DRAFT_1768947 [Panus rudis PR-1116 ss-1]